MDCLIGESGALWLSNVAGEAHRQPAEDSAPPVKRFSNMEADISQAVFSLWHGLIVTRDGELWSWGRNATGQLGREGTADTSPWAPIPGLSRIVKAAVGDSIHPAGGYSLALDTDGVVWSWGDGNFSVLGRVNDRGRPAPVQGLPPIADISAGYYHVIALDTSGDLWVWGINYGEHLGVATKLPAGMKRAELNMTQDVPIKLELDARFVGASANQRESLPPKYVKQYSVAIDDTGRLWSWGNGGHGTLVSGRRRRDSPRPAPRDTGTPPLVEVAAGAFHAVALDNRGEFWTWGGCGIADARGNLLGTGGNKGSFDPVRVPLV